MGPNDLSFCEELEKLVDWMTLKEVWKSSRLVQVARKIAKVALHVYFIRICNKNFNNTFCGFMSVIYVLQI
jgi:hypothetical protein